MPTESADRFLEERAHTARGLTLLAGVDEAGRGPLAGPVVAAAVILPAAWYCVGLPAELDGLNDSKQLTELRREEYFSFLCASSDVLHAVALMDHAIIDAINILRATHRAMNAALKRLQQRPQHVLVDGLRVKTLFLPQTPLVNGDARSYSIAAASVLAKVTRDRLMVAADREWPQYGFARHKGYATPEHLAALAQHGPCAIHRRSFSPLRQPEPELFG